MPTAYLQALRKTSFIHDVTSSMIVPFCNIFIFFFFFYSEPTPLQRWQASTGYQCLHLIMINYHTRTLNVVLLYMYIESIFVLYVTLPLRGSLIGTIKKKIIIIITHLKSSKNKHHCHCHNILSQKQLSFFIKTK